MSTIHAQVTEAHRALLNGIVESAISTWPHCRDALLQRIVAIDAATKEDSP